MGLFLLLVLKLPNKYQRSLFFNNILFKYHFNRTASLYLITQKLSSGNMELIAFLPFILRFSKMLMLLNKRIKVHTYTHPRTHFYMQTKCLQPLVRPPSIAFVTSRRKNDSCIVPTYSSSVTGTQKFRMNNDASWMTEDEGEEEDEEEERGYRRIRDDCQAPSSQIHCFNQSPKGIKWSAVTLPCLYWSRYSIGKQGSGPDRGQSPVECGDSDIPPSGPSSQG